MSQNSQQDAMTNELFTKSYTAFRDILPDEYRDLFVQFQDSKAMIESIQVHCNKATIHKSRLLKCCKRISDVSEHIAPYFKAVDIFVSSHPEYAALAWGAIRMVFLMSSNFVTFLEKFSAMLTRLTSVLPAYEGHVDQLLISARKVSPQKYPDLSKALSFMYADIFQLCYEFCKLFSTKKSTWAQVRLRGSLLWKPFDIRFADLLKSFRENEQQFQLLLETSHASVQLKSIVNIQDRWNAQDQKELLRDEKEKQKAQEDERKELALSVQILKEWIKAPTWEDPFEEAIRRRSEGTGQWLFDHHSYQQWRNCDDSDPLDKDPRDVLLVQGKPGYGKTYLCATMIESLKSPSCCGKHSSQYVGFYFFDRQRAWCVHPDQAFRAILTQLLHSRSEDMDMMDIAFAMKYRHGPGQLEASQDEVLAILKLYLQRIGDVVLVFDGVEECSDYKYFFKLLEQVTTLGVVDVQSPAVTMHSRCSLAFFARPTVRLPKSFGSRHVSIALTSNQNWKDIVSYLRPRIEELIEDDLLPAQSAAHLMADRAADHANGMFLWAKLLIHHLRSEALMPYDRLDALNSLVYLEGLDALYGAILEKVIKSTPKAGRSNLQRLFYWLAGSLVPMRPCQLQYAINFINTDDFQQENVIPNFQQSILSMSGALVELAPDGTARFIHTSFVEYLKSQLPTAAQTSDGIPFSLSQNRSDCFIAASCLSYINYRLPRKPLSGSAEISPHIEVLRRIYPLLEYSIQFWVQHAIRGLPDTAHITTERSEMIEDGSLEQLFQQISTLMNSRERVTTWIESSWSFQTPTTLGLLPEKLGSPEMLSLSPPKQHAGLEEFVKALQLLNRDLEQLKESWSHVLSTTPNEIWSHSIPAFLPSRFWVGTNQASITSLVTRAQTKAQTSMLLTSRTADSGIHLGQARLIPPRQFSDLSELGYRSPLDAASFYSVGWVFIYEIWSIETKSIVIHIRINVSEDEMLPLLYDVITSTPSSWSREKKQIFRFEFPVAISPNVWKCLFLGQLITVKELHKLDPTARPSSNYTFKTLNPCYGLHEYAEIQTARLYSYNAWFSPSSDYVMIMRPAELQSINKSWSATSWVLEILREHPDRTELLPVSAIEIRWAIGNFGKIQGFDHDFCFHPSLPILAVSDEKETIIWRYDTPNSAPVMIYSKSLIDAMFSTCGSYIYGTSKRSSQFVVLNISAKLETLFPSRDSCEEASEASSSALIHKGALNGNLIGHLALSEMPTIQNSQTAIFGQVNGVSQISVLQQLAEAGTLVMHRFCEDGSVSSATLTRLPKDLWSTRVSLVPCSQSDPDTLRMVINNNRRQLYNFDPEADVNALPAVIERKRDSIPTMTSTLNTLPLRMTSRVARLQRYPSSLDPHVRLPPVQLDDEKSEAMHIGG